MKKSAIIIAALSLAAFGAETEKETTTNVVPFRAGIGAVGASDGFGASGRIWIQDKFGFTIEVNSSWDQEHEGGEARVHYKLLPDALFRPYLSVGGGVQRFDIIDIAKPLYNETVGVFTAGAGVEALLGESERHGLSLELAYNHGEIEYDGISVTNMGDANQESTASSVGVKPFSIGLQYHFYFIPSKDKDSDGDGVFNSVDKCIDDAEDMDGFVDSDGCPDLDNDNDGINDSDDKCPTDAEDMDGFEDEDGCPETDNDEDSVEDTEDRCPNKAEDRDEFEDEDGCPELDNDGDGINDSDDKCPNQAEVVNNFEDEDGCPDEKPTVEEIQEEIAQLPVNQIAFGRNSAELTEESLPIIDELATFLNKWETVSVEVQGHTDSRGSAELNTKLSQKRADRVLSILVEKSVSKERLTAVGYGPQQPIADNATEEGRATNRRVEIVVQ